MNITYTSKFQNSFKQLPKWVKKQAISDIEIFREDWENPALRSHRLKGKLASYWSFSLANNYRILFFFTGKNDVFFVNIGTHSIYK